MWGSWLTAFACAGALGWFIYQSNGQEIYNYATATADMIIVAIGSMYFVAGSYKSNEEEEEGEEEDSSGDDSEEEDEEDEDDEEDDEEEAKGGRENNRGRTKNAMHQTQSKSTNNNNRNKHNNNNHSDSDSNSDNNSNSGSDSDASAIEKGNDATTPSAASAAIAAGLG